MNRLAAVAAAAGAAGAAWAGWVEPRRLMTIHETLALPRWPAALDGVRLGVLTDIHGGAPHAGAEAIARGGGPPHHDAPRPSHQRWRLYLTDERPAGVPEREHAVHDVLDGPALDRKLTALAAMASQTRGVMAAVDLSTFAAQVSEEAFDEVC